MSWEAAELSGLNRLELIVEIFILLVNHEHSHLVGADEHDSLSGLGNLSHSVALLSECH
jgi:hypothetical protein